MLQLHKPQTKIVDKIEQYFIDSDYNYYDIITLNKNGSYNDNIDYFSNKYNQKLEYYCYHRYGSSLFDSWCEYRECDKCQELILNFGKDEWFK